MSSFLESIKKEFKYYKGLGEKTFAQISDEKLVFQINEESNSIAVIVNHLNGNMLSRWTDFINSDGEKEWRKRDQEFVCIIKTRKELIHKWEEGWSCLFLALEQLTNEDLEKEVYIRNMGHTVTEAINRQLAHYAYHVGQIVYMGKIIQSEEWNSLSIAKGTSKEYNADKFSKPKRKEHFTDNR